MRHDDTTQPGWSEPTSLELDRTASSAYLIVIAGTNVGAMRKLGPRATVIGRGEDADLQFADEGVSRRHAAVTVEGSQVVLQDLGSSNGTFRNGVRIPDAVALTDGDKICVGGATILKFTYQDHIDERFQRNLYNSVIRDGLTQIFNRRYFDAHLGAELTFAQRHKTPLAIILVDVDCFKRINDRYGHQTGDLVLRTIGQRLSKSVRQEDIVARYGGEEFAVVCRNTDAARALSLGERLRRLVAERPFARADLSLEVTISLGIATTQELEAPGALELVKAADAALYEAKRRGRNRVMVMPDHVLTGTGTDV